MRQATELMVQYAAYHRDRRNIATHDYQKLNLAILRSIIEKHLEDFLAFSKAMLKLL